MDRHHKFSVSQTALRTMNSYYHSIPNEDYNRISYDVVNSDWIATLRLHTASLLQAMRSIEYASPVCCCDQKCFFIVGIQTSGMSIPFSLLLLGSSLI